MKRVVVGMSGGVDSSVAAWLLKQQGYDVIGLFMQNWEEETEDGVCSAEADYADVRRVCGVLDIPYYTVNFAKEYLDRVFARFLADYEAGRTPNPDVLCNREIKFGPFAELAAKFGADWIATGHYAGISHENGVHRLKKAADVDKDQTYFLNQLTQEQLKNVLFPLAALKKAEVRAIAEVQGLPTFDKKDSTGICFIGERRFREFLSHYLPAQPGDIVTLDGEVVGRHQGAMYYTVGQRKGLGIGGKPGESEGRWFVVSKDVAKNLLVVQHCDGGALLSASCIAGEWNWIPAAPVTSEFCCTARFRHRQPEQDVRVRILPDSRVEILFGEPQRAVAEGQYAVLYAGDDCLGGGVIEEVRRDQV